MSSIKEQLYWVIVVNCINGGAKSQGPFVYSDALHYVESHDGEVTKAFLVPKPFT